MESGEIYDAGRMEIDVISDADAVGMGGISYQDSIDIIRQELNSVQNSFIRIGWYLKHIRQNGLYQQEQYKNIYEFAEDKFRLKKSTVSRFINLCEQFSVNHDSPMIAEKYQMFSMSQLEGLLPLKPEELEKIDSGMTIKQIREAKRKIRERERERKKEDGPEEIVAASQQPEPDPLLPAAEEPRPEFANDKERKAWLENVEEWGLWYEDANIQARYYKYDFEDGSRLIAVKYRYTCPPYMQDEPESYRQQIEADGSYYGTPVYHVIYSDDYWMDHQDDYKKKYKKYCTHDAVKMAELVKFLRWLQGRGNKTSAYPYIEFDTAHLASDKKPASVAEHYMEFYSEHGYIPRFFCVRRSKEIKDYMPALITSCGSSGGTNSVSCFNLMKNIAEITENETISQEEWEDEIILSSRH